MKEIEYYPSTSESGFIEFARSFSEAAGVEVPISDRRLVLPPEIASGRISFYELNDGLGLGLVDCEILETIKVVQTAVKGGDNCKVIFNLSDWPIDVEESGRGVSLGRSLADAVHCASNSMASEACFEKGQRVKAVLLHLRRGWIVNYLLQNPVPLQVDRVRKFVNYEPFGFSTVLDLKSYELLNEMLEAKAPGRVLCRMLEGYAYQLIALFFSNLTEEEISGERIVSEDVMRIMRLKEDIETNLRDPLPGLEKAAAICLMSRTKFIDTFKALFSSTYGAFFLDIKMKKARELLQQGIPISDAAYEVGYVNISHFVKAFRLHEGITPGAYQRSSGRKEKTTLK